MRGGSVAMYDEPLVSSLKSIVGSDFVICHPDDLIVYEYDGSVDKAIPDVVVLPETTAQISSILSLAHEKNIPVVCRGAGTGLSGGSIATHGGVQISLSRMTRILEIDPLNLTALVEPGVINLDITKAVAKHSLYYSPDPSSQKSCTIGGNVAENAGGPHCLKYGVTTNHVLGMEVVLEDGKVVELGGYPEAQPGYDLRGAFIGGEGTLGIATKVLVRLSRKPSITRTFMAIFADLDSASTAVTQIIGARIVPAALEMIDALAIKAIENARPMGYPRDAGAVLLIEIEGLAEDVNEESEAITSICEELGVREIRYSELAEERERLWAGRKGAFAALGSLAPNYYLVDGVVPRTRLPDVLQKIAKICSDLDLPVANVFHAGDGNLHPLIAFDERQPGSSAKALQAGEAILELCIEAGGVLTGEHGVGIEKKEYMPLMFTPDDLSIMKAFKQAFSPKSLLNPGKIFPDGKKPTQKASIRVGSFSTTDSDVWI
tara:strand:- start:168 stop:1637 length:1470 start_codon:yes stop_codon:yes gene_type:complete